jgi:hypothetical protein
MCAIIWPIKYIIVESKLTHEFDPIVFIFFNNEKGSYLKTNNVLIKNYHQFKS